VGWDIVCRPNVKQINLYETSLLWLDPVVVREPRGHIGHGRSKLAHLVKRAAVWQLPQVFALEL